MKKINISIILIIFSNVLFLSGCQTGQTKAPKVLAEFYFNSDDGHIFLPVTFKEKEYPFILDTAGMETLFDDSFKDQLGKRFLWPNKGRGPEGKKFKIEYYLDYEAYLGPLRLDDNSLISVVDLDKLVPGNGRKFQGIIGLDFLKKYIVQIDFDDKKVTFLKGKKDFDLFSLFKPKVNKHPEWGEPVSMKAQFLTDLRHIKGTLYNDRKIDFLVDTGWLSLNSLESGIFDKIYSQNFSNNNPEVNHKSAKYDYNKINVIEKYSVGPFEYENDVFRRSNKSVLGLMFFNRHIVTLDFPNNVMYLKKGKNFDKKTVIYIFLGEKNCVLNSENYSVVKVDPNSLAYEKGIREKDVLLKVNNYDVSSLNVAEFMNLPISRNDDRETIFTFKRGDDIFTVTFVGSGNKTDKH